MTLNDIRIDRAQFMRHFEKEPRTISIHPADFSQLVNDDMGMAVQIRADAGHCIMGMDVIEDPKMPRGEIVLQ